ncbi:YueI family protein [Bacillus sp. 03113]|uniref:YueI family protein n=1 Tax=Bacillus sp. 03113 TaxID=2578211 RepID=UPI001144E722|nr:YueI family protein [Bacillus sp. 03113]
MERSNVDDYLQQGIHGVKETNPDERRKFLGTLRERIVVALYQNQLREAGIYPEVENAVKENSKAHLYLNGHMDYSYLSKYIKIANQHNVKYTMVTNKEHNSDIGLVLAFDYAIDKEEIFVTKNESQASVHKESPNKKGLLSYMSKLFKSN